MNNGSYPKKTGILGGTFNPIHKGHIVLAQNAMRYCDLNKVIFIPSGFSYLKDPSSVADKIHRKNMTALAIEGSEGFELSTLETDREGESYTYITLDILCRQNPDSRFYYIVGADTLLYMDKWKNPGDIFSKCSVICAKRDDHPDDELVKKAAEYMDRFETEIILMDAPKVDISSSLVRQKLENGQDCSDLLDERVIGYIKDNGLYGYDRNR